MTTVFLQITKLIVGLYALHAFLVILKVRNHNVFYLSSFHVHDITGMCVKI